jgi:hypothetical protein
MEISVLIYTARDDYPYMGKAEKWHCFEPFLRTLAKQTFQDFELVLVDALWETRPDWFRDRPQPFPVKHVPSRPNYWQERGRVGVVSQINRGFIWADGKYVWMGAENNLYPPHFLKLASDTFRSGKLPVAWYGMADRFDRSKALGACPDVSFDLEGFTRDDLGEMDHRASRFLGSAPITSPCHHEWYYGYSGIPLTTALAVNGFDELMDGIKSLQDCDMGSRIVRAGCQLQMHRDLYVIEPTTKPETGTEIGYGGGIRNQGSFQCNYAIYRHNILTGRRVNGQLPSGYVDDVKAKICHGVCPLQEKCRGGLIPESSMYPFCSGVNEAMAREWHAIVPNHELEKDRELRKQGLPPYDKGFVR